MSLWQLIQFTFAEKFMDPYAFVRFERTLGAHLLQVRISDQMRFIAGWAQCLHECVVANDSRRVATILREIEFHYIKIEEYFESCRVGFS